LVVSAGSQVPWHVAFPGKSSSFVFNQMESVKNMQKSWKHTIIAFDEEGTSLGVQGEHFFDETYPRIKNGTPNYFQVSGREREDMFDEIRRGLMSTAWWKEYSVKVMQAISTSRQVYERVYVVCLPGGPITDVERREMIGIVQRMRSDNRKQNIQRLGEVHERFCECWADFEGVQLQCHRENGGKLAQLSTLSPVEMARQAYEELVTVHGKCDLEFLQALGKQSGADPSQAARILEEFDEDGDGELNEEEYVSWMEYVYEVQRES